MSRPIARPTASSRLAGNTRIGGVSVQIRTGTDGPSPGSSRVSPSCLVQIEQTLTTDDQAVLVLLAEVRLATGHQLARRLWAATVPTDPRARRARRALARLERWRVIERLGRRMGGVRAGSTSIVYGLGPVGHRLLARGGFVPKRLGAPGERYIAHTLAITELVVRLAEGERQGELEVVALETEPACWRGFLGPFGARQILKPDLFARIGAGRGLEDRWWLEVDMASQSAATIVRKAHAYLSYWQAGTEQSRHDVFPRVAFAVPDHARLEQVASALARVREAPKGLFTVGLFEETIGRLAAEARS